MKDSVACYTLSLNLPFAQGRCCNAEGISILKTLSDTHDQSFGKAYGVLIKRLPRARLSWAVFEVDAKGTIAHAALAALKAVV